MRYLLFLILFTSLSCFGAEIVVTIENSMMSNTTGSAASLDLGTFDPFSPQSNCAGFISPNSCTVNGRDNVDIDLSFPYTVSIIRTAQEISSNTIVSIDMSMTADNGLSGTTGQVTNLSLPSPLIGLGDSSFGSLPVAFTLPLFGPASRSEYGINLIIDVTVNP